MSTTHTLIQTYQVDGVTQDTSTISVTDDDGNKFTETVPATTTNMQLFLAFTMARLKSIWIKCDQAIDLYTNATGGSGGDHIPLAAGVAVTWNTQMGVSMPFTHDVTTMYADNAGSSAGHLLIIYELHDI